MSEESEREEKPRKPSGPRGRGAAGGRPPTGAPRSSQPGKPRRSDDDRPKRDYPKRDGDDRPKRDYVKRDGDAARPKRDYGKPGATDRPKRSYDKGDAAARPKRDYGKPGATDRPKRPYVKRDGDARPPRDFDKRPARPPFDPDRIRPPRAGEGSDRPRHDDPPIAEDVAARDLDKGARVELKSLTKENADFVAEHLVMAGRLIESDPATAHLHALAAARRGGRIGVVREAVGITAYATGDFALALRELRTYRRITGRNDQLPLMVDSERGVDRPAAALELGRSVPRDSLEVSVQVALAIAMSGARLDLGQPELALTELQIPQLDPERAFSWSPALFDAYATVLEELGHDEEAEQWWQRSDRATIALEQAAIPEGEDTVEIIEEQFDELPAPVDGIATPDSDDAPQG